MAKAPNVSEHAKAKILKLLIEDQVEPASIAQRFGITRGAVYMIAKRAGLKADPSSKWSERNSGASIESKSRIN